MVADPEFVDPLEKQGDVAAEHYGFTTEERAQYVALQRSLAGNPALMKKLVKRQRRMARGARMAPSLKEKR